MLPVSPVSEKVHGYIQRSLDALRALDPDVPFKKTAVWNGPIFSHECESGLRIRIKPSRDIPELGHAPCMCVNVIEVSGFSKYELPCIRFFHSKPIPVCASDAHTPENPAHPAPHTLARAYGEAHAFPDMKTIETLGFDDNQRNGLVETPYGQALTTLLAYHVWMTAPKRLIDMGWILNPFDLSGPTAHYVDAKRQAGPSPLRHTNNRASKNELVCVREAMLASLPFFSATRIAPIMSTHVSPVNTPHLPVTDLPEVDTLEALAAAEKLGELAKDIRP